MSYIHAIPHSKDPKALEALDATLKDLPMGGARLVRVAGDVVIFADQSVAMVCSNERFIAFAVVNQGYVKSLVAPDAAGGDDD